MAKSGKQAPYMANGEIKRIMSLGGGTYAYVFDAHGKTHHVKRGSDEMIQVCRETDEAMNGKVTAQLKDLGWEDVIELMQTTSVPSSGDSEETT